MTVLNSLCSDVMSILTDRSLTQKYIDIEWKETLLSKTRGRISYKVVVFCLVSHSFHKVKEFVDSESLYFL